MVCLLPKVGAQTNNTKRRRLGIIKALTKTPKIALIEQKREKRK